jgi:hypothetical protein
VHVLTLYARCDSRVVDIVLSLPRLDDEQGTVEFVIFLYFLTLIDGTVVDTRTKERRLECIFMYFNWP